MSEFELIELQSIFASGAGTLFMNFVTIMSGYLVANYYMGPNLKAIQFWILTIIYSLVSFSNIAAVYGLMDNVVVTGMELELADRTLQLSAQPTNPAFVSVLMASMYLGSVYFGWISKSK